MMYQKIEAAAPADINSVQDMQIEASQIEYNVENARQLARVAHDKFVEIERYITKYHSTLANVGDWSTVKALLNVVDDQLDTAFKSAERIGLAVVVTGSDRPL